MKRLIILAVLLTTVLPFSVRAQSTPPAPCDISTILKAASTFKGKDMDALLQLDSDIQAAYAACNGLSFKGTGVKVLPPFTIPKGFYKVTAKSKGYLIVNLHSLDGSDCAAGVDA